MRAAHAPGSLASGKRFTQSWPRSFVREKQRPDRGSVVPILPRGVCICVREKRTAQLPEGAARSVAPIVPLPAHICVQAAPLMREAPTRNLAEVWGSGAPSLPRSRHTCVQESRPHTVRDPVTVRGRDLRIGARAWAGAARRTALLLSGQGSPRGGPGSAVPNLDMAPVICA